MNRVKRLALVTAVPVGAALVVAMAPAWGASGGGSGYEPGGAVAARDPAAIWLLGSGLLAAGGGLLLLARWRRGNAAT